MMPDLASDTSSRPRDRRIEFILLALALLIAATIGTLKIGALKTWRFSSDLFTHDAMFRETLRGHFGMEYAYGKQLGDHAYLIYAFFLPLKAILGQHMATAMTLFAPITMVLTGIFVYGCVTKFADRAKTVAVTTILLFTVCAIRGPFEHRFGFHDDTLSGYLAVILAAILLLRQHIPTRQNAAAAIVVACVLALLKEEMALLGIIFFTALAILNRFFKDRRDPIVLPCLLLCTVLFVLEMCIIHNSRTPWNRGNDTLIKQMLDEIKRLGIFRFLFAAEKIEYWITISALLIVFGICCKFAGRINRIAAALALTALAKLAFAWSLFDFDIGTWHNFPALFMLTGAIALQTIEMQNRKAVTAVVALFIATFIAREIPHAFYQHRQNRLAAIERDRLRPSLLDVMQHVDRSKVASVPRWTAYEWPKYRVSLFPRGVTERPEGIADQVILLRRDPQPETDVPKAFTLVYQNRRYRLYRRTGFLPGEEQSRNAWVKMFGRESIGLPDRAKKSNKK